MMVMCTKFVTDNDNIIVKCGKFVCVCVCVEHSARTLRSEKQRTRKFTQPPYVFVCMCRQQIKTILILVLGWLQVFYIKHTLSDHIVVWRVLLQLCLIVGSHSWSTQHFLVIRNIPFCSIFRCLIAFLTFIFHFIFGSQFHQQQQNLSVCPEIWISSF